MPNIGTLDDAEKFNRLLVFLLGKGAPCLATTIPDEQAIRFMHVHNVVRARGEYSAIQTLVKSALTSIKFKGLETDSRLVADVIAACSIGAPDAIYSIIKGVIDTGDLLARMGEGILIGLLEICNSHDGSLFELHMLAALKAGPVLEAMKTSTSTSAGSGRLSNTLQLFLQALWMKSPHSDRRRNSVFDLIAHLKDPLILSQKARSKDSTASPTMEYRYVVPDGSREVCFLETFMDELTKKALLQSTLGLRLEIFNLLKPINGALYIAEK